MGIVPMVGEIKNYIKCIEKLRKHLKTTIIVMCGGSNKYRLEISQNEMIINEAIATMVSTPFNTIGGRDGPLQVPDSSSLSSSFPDPFLPL
jgi:hypothetical protein